MKNELIQDLIHTTDIVERKSKQIAEFFLSEMKHTVIFQLKVKETVNLRDI